MISRIDDNATCAVSVPQDTSIVFGANKFTAVGGPATFAAPATPLRVIDGIRDYMARHNLARVSDIAIPR